MEVPEPAPSLVTGLGDEVVVCAIVLFLIFLVTLAWWSTAVRERPRFVQAVLLRPAAATSARSENVVAEESRPDGENEEGAAPSLDEEEENRQSSDVVDDVRIKLRYLNDSQREVRSALSESLGRFRRRHFAEDLAENKTVKLIFNGHVLSDDRRSLSHLGLFDNCVVHCVITRSREPGQNRPQQQDLDSDRLRHPEDTLDLSHICYPLVGSLLIVIWWCQLVYAHYFSMASTVSLISLTLIFLASIANTYLY